MFSRGYEYDPIGNRTSSTEGTSPAVPTDYTSNALNQYAGGLTDRRFWHSP